MSNKPLNIVGYWASQEQYSMQDLLKFVAEAERGGFSSCLTSDHFHPWWHDNGYGNFTWVWSAAAAERTKNMDSYIRSNRSSISSPIDAQAFAFRISGQNNTSNLGVHKA